jgi:mRNA-degrading endonuclease RelE of RelBE toxin-antitoxin system
VIVKPFEITIKARALKILSEKLPTKIVDAATNFIYGPLAENPKRVGKRLNAPFVGQWSAKRGDYRIIYSIDEERGVVTVLDIAHRAHVYAPRA